MGDGQIRLEGEGEQRRLFMRHVLNDLRALEQMMCAGMIESGVRRIGAEQEVFLVDRRLRAACRALELLEEIDDPHVATELG